MKKTLFLLIALLSLISLTACVDDEEDGGATTSVEWIDPEDGTLPGELFGTVDPAPWG